MHKNPTRILSFNRHAWTKPALLGCLWFLAATVIHAAEPVASLSSADLDKQIGKAVDIASSAYQYRADRKTEENAPESWVAIMRFAGQPLNAPADVQAPAVKQVLRAFLWEENRPIKQVELIWSPEAKRRPIGKDLVFSSLTGPTWWSKSRLNHGWSSPKVSADGNTWSWAYPANTCGLVISVKDGAKFAADYDMPTVRVLVADVWKKMEIEIEWGFDQATAEKDYSGRIETYDGRVSPVVPLDGDTVTKVMEVGSWGSSGKAANRRGIKFSLLYMGTSTWRKPIPYHNFQEDVARSIITVWTKSGNFSFLAADLEHGPILAPEYGFFVRRTSTLATPAPATEAPISLASNATNARDFLKELKGKNQKTVRQMIRARAEQT